MLGHSQSSSVKNGRMHCNDASRTDSQAMMPVGVTVSFSESDNYAGQRERLSVHNVIKRTAEGMI